MGTHCTGFTSSSGCGILDWSNRSRHNHGSRGDTLNLLVVEAGLLSRCSLQACEHAASLDLFYCEFKLLCWETVYGRVPDNYHIPMLCVQKHLGVFNVQTHPTLTESSGVIRRCLVLCLDVLLFPPLLLVVGLGRRQSRSVESLCVVFLLELGLEVTAVVCSRATLKT